MCYNYLCSNLYFCIFYYVPFFKYLKNITASFRPKSCWERWLLSLKTLLHFFVLYLICIFMYVIYFLIIPTINIINMKVYDNGSLFHWFFINFIIKNKILSKELCSIKKNRHMVFTYCQIYLFCILKEAVI